jgi:hypothetical protein
MDADVINFTLTSKFVMLNLFQHPSCSKTRVRKDKWTLKQVQGDAGFSSQTQINPASIHMLPAVNRQRRSGDEIRILAGQKLHAAGDFVGLA